MTIKLQEGEDITREEDDDDDEEEDEDEYDDEDDFEDDRQRRKRRRQTGFILEEAGLCSLLLKLILKSCVLHVNNIYVFGPQFSSPVLFLHPFVLGDNTKLETEKLFQICMKNSKSPKMLYHDSNESVLSLFVLYKFLNWYKLFSVYVYLVACSF